MPIATQTEREVNLQEVLHGVKVVDTADGQRIFPTHKQLILSYKTDRLYTHIMPDDSRLVNHLPFPSRALRSMFCSSKTTRGWLSATLVCSKGDAVIS